MNNTPPTTEERIWAVLAHLSALAFGMGILLPIIGWSEQRRKSKYVSFQCLQALGYQSLGFTIWILSFLLVVLVLSIVVLVMTGGQSSPTFDSERLASGFTGLLTLGMFGLFGVYAIIPVIAAIACGLGKDFNYPIMGKRLAKYLGYGQTGTSSEFLIEECEDRWVVAMGHFAAIILLWGILAPLTTWILQAKRNVFLKFQSIQTLIFQVIVTLLYFGGIFIYLIGLLAVVAVIGLSGDGGLSGGGLFGFGIFIVFSLIAFLAFLLVPLFHILGQWAGYRVLKGDDYRYPVIGKLVENRVSKYPMASLSQSES